MDRIAQYHIQYHQSSPTKNIKVMNNYHYFYFFLVQKYLHEAVLTSVPNTIFTCHNIFVLFFFQQTVSAAGKHVFFFIYIQSITRLARPLTSDPYDFFFYVPWPGILCDFCAKQYGYPYQS